MLSQCADCPRRAAGLAGPCIAQHMINDVYCVLARMGEAWALAAILAWQPCGLATEHATGEPSTSPALPSVAESLSVLQQMKACPHRTAETTCGCGGVATCTLGKGKGGLVSHADCFACLQAPTGADRRASSGSGS
jgi:hypothetical protein